MGLTFFNTKPLLFLISCISTCSLLSSCNGDFEEKYEQLKQDKEALVTQIASLEAQLSHAQREIRLLKRKLPEEPTTIDLIQLIKKLTPQLSWWTETENNSPLVWNHAGLIDGDNGFAFKREGKALVSLGGKVIEVLEQKAKPLYWDVKLYGPKAGIIKVDIRPNRTLAELVAYQLAARIKKREESIGF